jgi:hypothetical protein
VRSVPLGSVEVFENRLKRRVLGKKISMVALPKFMRRLKFDSQAHLIGLICLSIDGFMRSTDHEDDGYASYEEYILSRYVNIMPSYVGVSGMAPTLLDECVFRFQIGQVPAFSYVLGGYTKVYAYGEFRNALRNDFLPKNCPGFNSLPEFS